MKEHKIRIGIVEDDILFSQSLQRFLELEPDFAVVGSATTSESALKLAKEENPEIIIMDLNLSGNNYDGIYASFEILDATICKIIILTSCDVKEIILQIFTAGAVNYINKTQYRQLPNAIRTACSGLNPIELLVQDYATLKHEEVIGCLSDAEREVFDLIESGYTQPQVGRKLFKSASTIKNQVNSVLKKLKVINSKEAIRKIKRRGL